VAEAGDAARLPIEGAQAGADLLRGGFQQAVQVDLHALLPQTGDQPSHHAQVPVLVVAPDLDQVEARAESRPAFDHAIGDLAPRGHALEEPQVGAQAHAQARPKRTQAPGDGDEAWVEGGLAAVDQQLPPPIPGSRPQHALDVFPLQALLAPVEGAEAAGVHAAPVDLDLDGAQRDEVWVLVRHRSEHSS